MSSLIRTQLKRRPYSSSIHQQGRKHRPKILIHCPKSNKNFQDITRNVKENEIIHEIFRVVPTVVVPALHFVLYLGKSITFGTV